MKKIINLQNTLKSLAILAFAGLFAIATPAFAANVTFNTGSSDCATVRVQNVTQGTPTTGEGPNGCDSLGNWTSGSVSANPGDIIAVAVYYHNTGSTPATNTKIRVSSPQSYNSGTSHTISANVAGGNGGYVSDSVTVYLSESQTLTYIPNSQDSDSTVWFDNSNQMNTISSNIDQNLFNNTGVLANGDGNVSQYWADQGTLRLRFQVGEDNTPDSPDVTTEHTSSEDVDDVTLHGTINNYNEASLVWFEVREENGSTYDITSQIPVNAGNATQSFNDEVDGQFNTGEVYSYRACGMFYNEPNTYTDCGSYETFTIGGGNENDQEPVADTFGADEIEDDSAELNGSVDMNDFEDGIVFFAYGQNQNDVSDLEQDFDTYSDADDAENGDDFQVILVDSNHDGDANFAEDISGLESDEEYFYQICVQFENENGDDEIECGGVENFYTDDENNNDNLFVNTFTAQDVDNNSAELRGDIDEIGNENVYRYFEWGTNTNMNNELYLSGSTGSTGEFSRVLHGLNQNTTYYYRACAEEVDGGDYDCGVRRSFETTGNQTGGELVAITTDPSSVGQSSAVLNGLAVSPDVDIDKMWFQWGSTVSLERVTSQTTVNASGTQTLSRSVSGLSANTTYYYRVVAVDEDGNTEYGLRKIFRTDRGTVIINPNPNPPVVINEVNGAGSLFLALNIEPDFENVVVGDTIDYTVTYRNISDTDLEDVVVQVIFAEETRFVKSTAGFYSQPDHNLTVVVGDLDEDEQGEFVVRVEVLRGAAGDLIVAQANAGHNHPSILDAQVGSVPAYAINNVVNNPNRLGAFAFGAGFFPTTFLGWLILLIVIILLVLLARRLYTDYEGKKNTHININ